jgi:undecaprenyl diphosphate synthase
MGLLRYYLESEIEAIHQEGVRLSVIGDRQRLSADIIELIEKAEQHTAGNTRLTLTIAISYGGRAEIAAAAQSLAREVAEGRLNPDRIDENEFQRHLYTAGLPDPDLLIRTSGEMRISNFLLWQLAYSEFVFIDTLWPDFTRDDFAAAVTQFRNRVRRYGATGD